ncbi:MAG TPA: ATP-binding protein [Bryobacteraceae bacterium]|nr:ATP-binding protein [Bryobacteraceae bacterium]
MKLNMYYGPLKRLANYRASGLAAAVCVAGIALSGFIFVTHLQEETLDFQNDLRISCENRTAAIRRELDADLAALQALRAHMETAPPTEQQFNSFAQRLLSTTMSVRSLEWVPRVREDDRRKFESDLGGRFIWVGDPARPRRAPEGSDHFPVYLIYPNFHNWSAVGFDANSSSGCRRAMALCEMTDTPGLTEKFPIVERTGDGFGVIGFLPVRRPAPGSGEIQMTGFAVAVLQVGDIVESALSRAGKRDMDLYVFDRSAAAAKALLFYHPAPTGTRRGMVKTEAALASAIRQQNILNVGGRQWAFVFVPTPEYLAGVHSARPWLLLLLGLLLTGAAVSYLVIHASHTRRIMGLVGSVEGVNRQLKAARDEAIEASSSKTRFLANMSHEIRTPMNGVLATTELVLNTNLTAEQRELISACHSSGQQLLTLLNDILDLSRCESGKLALESAPFDLRAQVKAVLRLHAVTAQRKGVRLNLQWKDGVPQWIVGDSTRFRQVLTNLLSNALKFTDKGSVNVQVSKEDIAEGKIHLLLTVRDTGIGIAPEILPKLFSPFVQADLSTKYGGAGLGLAICKQLVTLMHGTIAVESTEGEGSTFIVELDAEPCRPQATGEADFSPLPARLRVLVAEDNPVNQLVTRRLLERHECVVDVVATGVEALEQYQRASYDVVLMDCQMPEMDGYEAARRIRALPGDQRAAIIALTALAFPNDRERCLEAGMDDHISKPISAKQLVAALHRWAPSHIEAAG